MAVSPSRLLLEEHFVERTISFAETARQADQVARALRVFCRTKAAFPDLRIAALGTTIWQEIVRSDPSYEAAALANRYVATSEDSVPFTSGQIPVRVQFQTAVFFGRVPEAISMWLGTSPRSAKLSWGQFVSVSPLRTEDPIHPRRTVYMLLENNVIRAKMTTRNAARRILGKSLRKYVSLALRKSYVEFVRLMTAPENKEHIPELLSRLGASDLRDFHDLITTKPDPNRLRAIYEGKAPPPVEPQNQELFPREYSTPPRMQTRDHARARLREWTGSGLQP